MKNKVFLLIFSIAAVFKVESRVELKKASRVALNGAKVASAGIILTAFGYFGKKHISSFNSKPKNQNSEKELAKEDKKFKKSENVLWESALLSALFLGITTLVEKTESKLEAFILGLSSFIEAFGKDEVCSS